MKNAWKIILGIVASFVAVVAFYFRPRNNPKTGAVVTDLDAIRARQRDATASTRRSQQLNTELGEKVKLSIGENRAASEGIERSIDLAKRDRELIKEAKSLIDSLKQ